jgi:hypothetical protein
LADDRLEREFIIPKPRGDKVKTNRRDALSLAKLLRADELTAVWVPDGRHEAMRDLTRARESSDAFSAWNRGDPHLCRTVWLAHAPMDDALLSQIHIIAAPLRERCRSRWTGCCRELARSDVNARAGRLALSSGSSSFGNSGLC